MRGRPVSGVVAQEITRRCNRRSEGQEVRKSRCPSPSRLATPVGSGVAPGPRRRHLHPAVLSSSPARHSRAPRHRSPSAHRERLTRPVRQSRHPWRQTDRFRQPHPSRVPARLRSPETVGGCSEATGLALPAANENWAASHERRSAAVYRASASRGLPVMGGNKGSPDVWVARSASVIARPLRCGVRNPTGRCRSTGSLNWSSLRCTMSARRSAVKILVSEPISNSVSAATDRASPESCLP